MRVFQVVNLAFLLVVVFLTLYPFLNIVARSLPAKGYINAGQVNLFPRGLQHHDLQADPGRLHVLDQLPQHRPLHGRGHGHLHGADHCFAYALAKKDLKGRGVFVGIAVFTMFFTGGLIPNYVLISSLGMRNTIWAVVLPNAISVFNLLVMKAFFESLPIELEEAAAVDGLTSTASCCGSCCRCPRRSSPRWCCSTPWPSGTRGSRPSSTWTGRTCSRSPSTCATSSPASTTAGSAGGTAENVGQIAANIQSVTIVLTVLPILCVYPFVQRYFVSGVMLGAVKG